MRAHQDTCWRCGVTCTPEPHPVLRLIDGGAASGVQPAGVQPAEVQQVSTAERLALLVAEARA